MWRFSLFILLSFMLSVQVSMASSVDEEKQKLQELKEKVTETEHARASAQARINRLTKELERQQTAILSKAADIQRLERDVAVLEREVNNLFREEAAKSKSLSLYKHKISRMVSAAWTMQHRPQLAAFLLPEETRHSALTSRALHMTTISLKEEMDEVNFAIIELEKLRQTIVDKQNENKVKQANLAKERVELQHQLDEHQRVITQLSEDDSRYAIKLEMLRRKTSTVESLVQKLESTRQEEAAAYSHIQPQNKPSYEAADTSAPEPEHKPTPPATASRPRETRFAEARGSLPLPAQGVVTGKFGERRGQNDRLKGLEMETIKGAIVSAPYQGEVLFTGPFLDYGNMVILRHSRDYHTLIAGLSRIDVRVGQFLLDGEPIGAMGEPYEKRKIYIELRQRSQAVDPAPWFALQKHHYAKR